MASVNVYLNFDGNCEEAFEHYKNVFGSDYSHVSRYAEMPSTEDFELSADEANKIMHISLPVGDSTVLMGSDAGGNWAPNFQQGNNFSVSVNADSKEEADKIFNKLSDGGMVTMPLETVFWGDYFGMCTDKFGVNWMMSHNPNTK